MSEINTQKPFFMVSCILHVVILLGLIFSISLSGSPSSASSQPNIIQAVAVSSSALTQYQNAIVQKQQAAQKVQQMIKAEQAAQQLAQQKAADLAAQQAAQKVAAAKAAAMKQSIEKQLKESMQKQLAHAPPPTIQKNTSPAKTKTVSTGAHAASMTKTTPSSNTDPGLADKYKAMIIQAISEQWVVPQHLPKNISCVLDIRVAPGGVVLQVSVKKSSGNPVLDNSAMAAVNKASPLPVPSDPSLFDAFRTITLTVKPDGSLLEG